MAFWTIKNGKKWTVHGQRTDENGECAWKYGQFLVDASVKVPAEQGMCKICQKNTLLEFKIDEIETFGRFEDFNLCEKCANENIRWCHCKKHSVLLDGCFFDLYKRK